MSKFLLFIGVFFITISIAMSGFLNSGHRLRSAYSNESSEDRQGRLKIAGILFLIGSVVLGVRYLIFI